jgi:aminopeptidase
MDPTTIAMPAAAAATSTTARGQRSHPTSIADMPREVIFDPSRRSFPPFDPGRLLSSVFHPTAGCRICILIDFPDPPALIENFAFLSAQGHQTQKNAHKHFYLPLQAGLLGQLGMSGGELFAYRTSGGSNLDLSDEVWDTAGELLSLDADIYPHYDIILCVSTYSATAPLTAKCKQFGFRGATLHGLNDIILNSGLAVDYEAVSEDAEKIRLAMTRADEIEIDFTLEDGRVLTAWLGLDGQEAQKSHGLCQGNAPDVANLPAGEVYFVPTDARGQFPMKYEDGTLGLLEVRDRNIVSSTLIEGDQATIDAHNARLKDDPMTGTLGELGFGTQVLPVSGADIQDEKVLGTCHLATGRDDHLGGDITPGLFKRHENSTHDDILFAPHKTPNFMISQVRMRRGTQREIIIENFRPSEYILQAAGA